MNQLIRHIISLLSLVVIINLASCIYEPVGENFHEIEKQDVLNVTINPFEEDTVFAWNYQNLYVSFPEEINLFDRTLLINGDTILSGEGSGFRIPIFEYTEGAYEVEIIFSVFSSSKSLASQLGIELNQYTFSRILYIFSDENPISSIIGETRDSILIISWSDFPSLKFDRFEIYESGSQIGTVQQPKSPAFEFTDYGGGEAEITIKRYAQGIVREAKKSFNLGISLSRKINTQGQFVGNLTIPDLRAYAGVGVQIYNTQHSYDLIKEIELNKQTTEFLISDHPIFPDLNNYKFEIKSQNGQVRIDSKGNYTSAPYINSYNNSKSDFFNHDINATSENEILGLNYNHGIISLLGNDRSLNSGTSTWSPNKKQLYGCTKGIQELNLTKYHPTNLAQEATRKLDIPNVENIVRIFANNNDQILVVYDQNSEFKYSLYDWSLNMIISEGTFPWFSIDPIFNQVLISRGVDGSLSANGKYFMRGINVFDLESPATIIGIRSDINMWAYFTATDQLCKSEDDIIRIYDDPFDKMELTNEINVEGSVRRLFRDENFTLGVLYANITGYYIKLFDVRTGIETETKALPYGFLVSENGGVSAFYQFNLSNNILFGFSAKSRAVRNGNVYFESLDRYK